MKYIGALAFGLWLLAAMTAGNGCGGRAALEPIDDGSSSTGGSTTSSSSSGSGGSSSSSSSSSSSTSSSSSSSSSASSSASSGSGLCDDTSSCDGCVQCAFNGPCIAPWDACMNSPACMDFADCLSNCPGGPCFPQCAQQYPDGVDLYLAAVSCLFCDECPHDCQGQAPPGLCNGQL